MKFSKISKVQKIKLIFIKLENDTSWFWRSKVKVIWKYVGEGELHFALAFLKIFNSWSAVFSIVLVLFCFSGGKSFFTKTYMVPKGYVHVNRVCMIIE